jgi:putative endonuclease
MRQPVVYILASVSGRALYIGVTTDLVRRLSEHRAGKVTFTSKCRITRLIFVEPHDTAPAAMPRETQLKGWRGGKKIAINQSNPGWRDLSGEIDGCSQVREERSLDFAPLGMTEMRWSPRLVQPKDRRLQPRRPYGTVRRHATETKKSLFER